MKGDRKKRFVLALVESFREGQFAEMKSISRRRRKVFHFPDVYYLKFYGISISSEKSGSVRNINLSIISPVFSFFLFHYKKTHNNYGHPKPEERKRDNNKGYINDSDIFLAGFFLFRCVLSLNYE